jgi:hypothetical protein
MDAKKLKLIMNDYLAAHGFARKGTTWYRTRAETLQLINLQRSEYGVQHYLNLAFVPSGMLTEENAFPKEYQCPIRIRMPPAKVESESQEIERLFNLEIAEMSDQAREAGIRKMMESVTMPFLDEVGKVGLKHAVERGFFDGGSVTLAARKYLDSTTPGKT